MFIEVTRSEAISALASGREVGLPASGEILQLGVLRSKRACRRMLTMHARDAWDWHQMKGDEIPKITYLVRT
jgi:hypothetical protein